MTSSRRDVVGETNNLEAERNNVAVTVTANPMNPLRLPWLEN